MRRCHRPDAGPPKPIPSRPMRSEAIELLERPQRTRMSRGHSWAGPRGHMQPHRLRRRSSEVVSAQSSTTRSPVALSRGLVLHSHLYIPICGRPGLETFRLNHFADEDLGNHLWMHASKQVKSCPRASPLPSGCVCAQTRTSALAPALRAAVAAGVHGLLSCGAPLPRDLQTRTLGTLKRSEQCALPVTFRNDAAPLEQFSTWQAVANAAEGGVQAMSLANGN